MKFKHVPWQQWFLRSSELWVMGQVSMRSNSTRIQLHETTNWWDLKTLGPCDPVTLWEVLPWTRLGKMGELPSSTDGKLDGLSPALPPATRHPKTSVRKMTPFHQGGKHGKAYKKRTHSRDMLIFISEKEERHQFAPTAFTIALTITQRAFFFHEPQKIGPFQRRRDVRSSHQM